MVSAAAAYVSITSCRAGVTFTGILRRTGLAGSTFAAGVCGRTSAVTRFIGYVTIRIARTRGTDTAGVGRCTSVGAGF